MAETSWQAAFDLAPSTIGPISTPPDCEKGFRIKRACRTFDGAFFCGMEWDEWNLVRALVKPHNVVLELGARFGTTSCVLAERTGNAGNVVAVEPDPKAHKQLLRNRERHVRSTHKIFKPRISNLAMSENVSLLAIGARRIAPFMCFAAPWAMPLLR